MVVGLLGKVVEEDNLVEEDSSVGEDSSVEEGNLVGGIERDILEPGKIVRDKWADELAWDWLLGVVDELHTLGMAADWMKGRNNWEVHFL